MKGKQSKNQKQTSSGNSGNTARTLPRNGGPSTKKLVMKDIEDLIRNEKDVDLPDRTVAALTYELDPLNNRITPRPLLGGVGRRGKLYELSEIVEVVVGTGGVGYITFNPDVGCGYAVPNAFMAGPYSDRNIGSVSTAAFAGTEIPATNAQLPAIGGFAQENQRFWYSSKYTAASSQRKVQWQCVGYGFRVVREASALTQDGNILLYRSYNNVSVGGFSLGNLTSNKNYKLVQGADLAPGAKEIILSGTPAIGSWQIPGGNDSAFKNYSSLSWMSASEANSGTVVRSGLVGFFTATPGTKFRVELVAGYMLIGQDINPKVRFDASPREGSLLANARLSVVKPGRISTPDETRRGARALLKHAVAEEKDSPLYSMFKGVGRSLAKEASKVGGEILGNLLKIG